MKVFYSDISEFKFEICYFKKLVIQHLIENDITIDEENIVLVDEKKAGIIGHLLKLFRLFLLHRNEQETFISPSEEKIIIELLYDKFTNHKLRNEVDKNVIEELFNFIMEKKLGLNNISHKSNLDIDIDIFEKVYKLYQEYLLQSNIFDSANLMIRLKNEYEHNEEFVKYLNGLNYIVTFKKLGIIEKSWYIWLLKDASLYQINITLPMNEIFACDILPDSARIEIEKKQLSDFINFSTSEVILKYLSEVYFLKLILSYMSLLVNSRNELCLANVINVPERGLKETAFTHIKHNAAIKMMSMYQIIVSYITRIKLGGKGYAPEKECPLKDYVKGLSDFIEVMNKLHTIIEENDNPLQATNQIISHLKNTLVNYALTMNIGRTKIDNVMKDIMKEVTIANEEMIISELETPTRSVGSGATLRGRKTLRLIRNLLDNHALILFFEYEQNFTTSSQKTPLRIPSLVSKFRSPVLNLQDTSNEVPLTNNIKGIEDSEQLYFENYSSNITQTISLKRESDSFDFELKKRKKPNTRNYIPKLIDVTNISNNKLIIDKTQSLKDSVMKENNQFQKNSKSKVKVLPISKKQVLLKGQTKLSSFFNSK